MTAMVLLKLIATRMQAISLKPKPVMAVPVPSS
jgi:hypothetical protein